MIRPTWTPATATPDQRDLLKRVQAAWKAARVAEEAARVTEEKAWQLTQQLRESGVPDTSMCELVDGLTRPTLNRRLGPRGSRTEASPSDVDPEAG